MKIQQRIFYFICLVFFLVSAKHKTAAQNFDWAVRMGGISGDYGYGIGVDTSGNVYTTGRFIGTVDFDPGSGNYSLTSSGNLEIFISKLDATGNFLWAKRIGSSGADEASSLALDRDENIYITGTFRNTVDFDPDTGIFNLTSAGNADIFIAKFRPSGEFVWARGMGGIDNDGCFSIALDSDGNIYGAGWFSHTVDFDPGAGVYSLTVTRGTDPFVLKLDTSGNFVWARQIEGFGNNDCAYAIATDMDGNIYTSGRFDSIADFNPDTGTYNLSSAGLLDAFLLKLNSSGDFLWATRSGGPGNEEGRTLSADSGKSVYLCGLFHATVDFDPGPAIHNLTSAGMEDIFITKQDSLGSLVWAKGIGGTGTEAVYSIKSDEYGQSGGVIVTGYFSNTAYFDPGNANFDLTSAGSADIFLCRLDTTGNVLSTLQMGGIGFDFGFSMQLDQRGNIYVTGIFNSTADFDPGVGIFNMTSGGQSDIFVLKLDSTLVTGILENPGKSSSFRIFPNPTRGPFILSSQEEIIELEIFNATGQAVYRCKPGSRVVSVQLDSDGIYFFEAKIVSGMIRKKIVVTQ